MGTQQSASKDTEAYRQGYPGLEDDPSATKNRDFYFNEKPCIPGNLLVEEFHELHYGDYDFLESAHWFIQWLFPIREQGLNYDAQPLQLHEAQAIKENPAAMKRFVTSYRLILDFYGLELIDESTGAVARNPKNYVQNFMNLNTSSHNYLRITRILKCLGELGLEHYKAPLLKQFIAEAFGEEGLLCHIKRSLRFYWIETLRNDAERDEVKGLLPPPSPEPTYHEYHGAGIAAAHWGGADDRFIRYDVEADDTRNYWERRSGEGARGYNDDDEDTGNEGHHYSQSAAAAGSGTRHHHPAAANVSEAEKLKVAANKLPVRLFLAEIAQEFGLTFMADEPDTFIPSHFCYGWASKECVKAMMDGFAEAANRYRTTPEEALQSLALPKKAFVVLGEYANSIGLFDPRKQEQSEPKIFHQLGHTLRLGYSTEPSVTRSVASVNEFLELMGEASFEVEPPVEGTTGMGAGRSTSSDFDREPTTIRWLSLQPRKVPHYSEFTAAVYFATLLCTGMNLEEAAFITIAQTGTVNPITNAVLALQCAGYVCYQEEAERSDADQSMEQVSRDVSPNTNTEQDDPQPVEGEPC